MISDKLLQFLLSIQKKISPHINGMAGKYFQHFSDNRGKSHIRGSFSEKQEQEGAWLYRRITLSFAYVINMADFWGSLPLQSMGEVNIF